MVEGVFYGFVHAFIVLREGTCFFERMAIGIDEVIPVPSAKRGDGLSL